MRIYLLSPLRKCFSGRTGFHSHPFWQLDFFVADGKAGIGLKDNALICLKPDDSILIPPYIEHNVLAPKTAQVCSVKFEPEMDDLNISAPLIISYKKHKALFEGIFDPELNNKEIAGHYLSILLLTICENSGKPKAEFRDKRILKAMEFMEDNVFEDISLEDIASYVNMSKSNFAKLFKSELDISPMKKKRLLKLDKAMELLEFSDLNITEIAESLCFCDLQTFSRFFQKETGISPSSFLRHHRKK